MVRGFNPCMAMETNTNLSLPNYGIVGFGFGGADQLVPLMHLGFHGSPPLGLAHDGLVNLFVIWGFSCLCTEVNGGDLQTMKVSLTWVFSFLLFHFTLKLQSLSYF